MLEYKEQNIEPTRMVQNIPETEQTEFNRTWYKIVDNKKQNRIHANELKLNRT